MITAPACIRFISLLVTLIVSSQSYASGFIDESSATLTARNYYLDRNYLGETPYPAAREWAQGFIFKSQSGFTEGPIGFGVDFGGF